MVILSVPCFFFGLFITVSGQSAVEKRLDAIEQKLAKVDALLDGVEQLCQTISKIKTPGPKPVDNDEVGKEEIEVQDEDVKENEDENINDNGDGDVSAGDNVIVKVEQSKQHLEMLYLKLDSVNETVRHLTVLFKDDEGYIAEWYLYRVNGQQRTQGHLSSQVLSDGRVGYRASITIHDIGNLNHLILMIASPVYTAMVEFDCSSLGKAGIQTFDAVEYEILEYTPRIVVPGATLKSEGVIVTIKVSENVVEAMQNGDYRPRISISIMDTSETPAEYKQVPAGRSYGTNYFESSQTGLSVAVKEGSKDELVIKVHTDIAVFGGILVVNFPQNATGYISGFTYGIQMKVINEDNGDIMPYGTIGLYKSRDMVYTSPYMSIMCYVSGIPLPHLSILKKNANGLFQEVKSDYEIIFDNTSVYRVIEFDPEKSKNAAGEYMCRASNDAGTVVQHKIKYLAFERAKIDESVSRLSVNESDMMTVTCVATGLPVPELQVRANYEHGANLLEDENTQYRYKSMSFGKGRTLDLDISPPDENLSSVFCVALQYLEHKEFYVEEYFEIKLRPPKEGEN